MGNGRQNEQGGWGLSKVGQCWSNGRLIAKQKSRLIAHSHAHLTAFLPPSPLPLLLASSSKLFVSTFFLSFTNSVHAYTRQCLAQSRLSLRRHPSRRRISSRSWLTDLNLLALAMQYVFSPMSRRFHNALIFATRLM